MYLILTGAGVIKDGQNSIKWLRFHREKHGVILEEANWFSSEEDLEQMEAALQGSNAEKDPRSSSWSEIHDKLAWASWPNVCPFVREWNISDLSWSNVCVWVGFLKN